MDLLSPLSESAFKGRRHTSLRDDRVSFELTAEDIAHVARLTSGHSSRNLPLDLPALAEEEDWKVRDVCRETQACSPAWSPGAGLTSPKPAQHRNLTRPLFVAAGHTPLCPHTVSVVYKEDTWQEAGCFPRLRW